MTYGATSQPRGGRAHNARPAGDEPTSGPTGWPQARAARQWPPPPVPGPEQGVGWPVEGPPRRSAEQYGRRVASSGPRGPRSASRPGAARGRRAARGSGAPPPRRRRNAWRAYLLGGIVLVLVTAAMGVAIWGSGRLSAAPSMKSTPGPVTATPGQSAPAAPQPSPSTAPAAAPVVVDPGAGTFTQVNTEGNILGTAGTLRRFRIAVENGINEDPNAFADTVDKVLGDPRSWIASKQFRLQRVPASAAAEFTIYLASPTTSEAMCLRGGLHTEKFTSCRLPGQVIINDARWLTAIPDYGASLEVYQTYAINHEVGHQLGHGHEACPGPSQLAPVMQQQTYGLKGCVANPWPFVNGQRYAGAPIP